MKTTCLMQERGRGKVQRTEVRALGAGFKAFCHRSVFAAGVLLFSLSANAQLFTNLQTLGTRVAVGDPSIPAELSVDGPKGIVAEDIDGDGKPDLAVSNNDGTVTVLFGLGGGHFAPPLHLQTGQQELRGIVCADFSGDGRLDIVVAAPYAGQILLFANLGARSFDNPVVLDMWPGARNLAVGDFDGDGDLDLAVAGTTVGLRQLKGTGTGHFITVTNLVDLAATNPDFPKPVYSLSAFRPPGLGRDELAVTHADSDLIWILGAGPDGALAINGAITNQAVHALAIGPITQLAFSGPDELVTASRDLGTVEVHRGVSGPERFEQAVAQKIQVPGGPRALAIVDLDGDGWKDLVVVLRNFDRVLTYHNSNGVLVASTEMPVGKSPRELVTADFNGDGHPDVAVMNNDSSDVSVLFTQAGQAGFTTFDEIYPVDGEVSGLAVFDFNGDGRDDVIQLHRASGEVSVRLAGTNGLLGDPTFFSVGSLPSAHATVDVNNDGFADMVTANLGRWGIESGSVSVRLGDGHGGFGLEQRFTLPDTFTGGLFALVAADFDNDGNIDLAAGFFDCRLAFFRGNGDGTFTFTHAHRFVYESRVMVVGDFNHDGLIDIAGAGYAGDLVVIENKGDLLDTTTLTRRDYPAPGHDKFGTRDIVAADINGDGDLDLLIGSGNGIMLYLGGEGMDFTLVSAKLPGTDFPASAVALADFDGDGSQEIAVSCRILSCVSILKRGSDGEYSPSLSVNVPSGEFLATGDLDGDGKPDLIGSGSVLWTALSSRQPQPTAPKIALAKRPTLGKPVINEILAINTKLPLQFDQDRSSDWVELFNDSALGIPLNGWKLRLVQPDDVAGVVTHDFLFPPTAFFASQAHLLLVFSETRRTPYHTGFRLPGGGGVLSLINASGTVVDRVEYAEQQENISFGRYRDGMAAFTFNPFPSPGQPNTDNGPVDPIVALDESNFGAVQPGEPLRFNADGRDDVGIVSLTVVWKRLDIPDNEAHRIPLYDDGEHGDGGMLDGRFSGLLETGLPSGAEIQFYVEAVDLSGQTVILPNEPVFARVGQPIALYSLAVDAPRPALEISELVAFNTSGLRDELDETPDWAEIRNCSSSPVSLSGIGLGARFLASNSRYNFGAGDLLLPGEHRVVYCDNKPTRSARHAPFVLNRAGGDIVLSGTTTNGARIWIDSVTFGTQADDVAWARLGCGGPWWSTMPTPGSNNVAGSWIGLVSSNRTDFSLVIPTTTNRTYTVEFTHSLDPAAWTALPAFAGDGIEHVVTRPLVDHRFYRVRRE